MPCEAEAGGEGGRFGGPYGAEGRTAKPWPTSRDDCPMVTCVLQHATTRPGLLTARRPPTGPWRCSLVRMFAVHACVLVEEGGWSAAYPVHMQACRQLEP
jgi:hypothetical protein